MRRVETSVWFLKIRYQVLKRRLVAFETWASLHCRPLLSSPENPSQNQHLVSSSLHQYLNVYCLSSSCFTSSDSLWILPHQSLLALRVSHQMGESLPCSTCLWVFAFSWTQAWPCSLTSESLSHFSALTVKPHLLDSYAVFSNISSMSSLTQINSSSLFSSFTSLFSCARLIILRTVSEWSVLKIVQKKSRGGIYLSE